MLRYKVAAFTIYSVTAGIADVARALFHDLGLRQAGVATACAPDVRRR